MDSKIFKAGPFSVRMKSVMKRACLLFSMLVTMVSLSMAFDREERVGHRRCVTTVTAKLSKGPLILEKASPRLDALEIRESIQQVSVALSECGAADSLDRKEVDRLVNEHKFTECLAYVSSCMATTIKRIYEEKTSSKTGSEGDASSSVPSLADLAALCQGLGDFGGGSAGTMAPGDAPENPELAPKGSASPLDTSLAELEALRQSLRDLETDAPQKLEVEPESSANPLTLSFSEAQLEALRLSLGDLETDAPQKLEVEPESGANPLTLSFSEAQLEALRLSLGDLETDAPQKLEVEPESGANPLTLSFAPAARMSSEDLLAKLAGSKLLTASEKTISRELGELRRFLPRTRDEILENHETIIRKEILENYKTINGVTVAKCRQPILMVPQHLEKQQEVVDALKLFCLVMPNTLRFVGDLLPNPQYVLYRKMK